MRSRKFCNVISTVIDTSIDRGPAGGIMVAIVENSEAGQHNS